jgi:hypothetical protein
MTKLKFITPLILLIFILGCRKKNNYTNIQFDLDEKTTIISSSTIKEEIVKVDSNSITFTNDSLVQNEIKVGSIVVSDMSSLTPTGFLRKIISITNVNGKLVCQTETASLEEAIENGTINYKRKFTDADIIGIDTSGVDISGQKKTRGASFKFSFDETVYDEDNDENTTNDQIKLKGDFEFEPEFEFEMDIENNQLKKLLVKLNLKNTNELTTEAKLALANLNKEVVLKTFKLAPFTIVGPLGFPIPIADQSVVIVIGADGDIEAKVNIGAENVNNCSAGIKYENGAMNTVSTTDNNLTFKSGDFEAKASVEGWLKVRYDIKPYGLTDSKISLGIKGSAGADATITNNELTAKLEWGIALDAKAKFKVFSKTLLDYQVTFFDQKYPIGNPIIIPFNVNSGLVAHYPFNGNADDIINGNNGTVYGGATLTTDRHGNSNKAYSFDGVDDYIEIQNISQLNNLTNDNFAISFWTQSNINNGYPLCKAERAIPPNGHNVHFEFYTKNNAIEYCDGWEWYSGSSAFQNNQWYHIVFTRDLVNGYIMYVNGNIVNIQNSGGQIVNTNFATNNNLYVGLNTHVWEEFHNGAVDDIRIYNRALKKAEVDILFNE